MNIKEIGLGTAIIAIGAIVVYAGTRAIASANASQSNSSSGAPPVLFVPVGNPNGSVSPTDSSTPANTSTSNDANMAALTNSLQETLSAINANTQGNFTDNAFALINKISGSLPDDSAYNQYVSGSFDIGGQQAAFTLGAVATGARVSDTSVPGKLNFANPGSLNTAQSTPAQQAA